MVENKAEKFCEGCITHGRKSGSKIICAFEQNVNKLIKAVTREKESNQASSLSPSQRLSTLTQTARSSGCPQLIRIRQDLGQLVDPKYATGFRKTEVARRSAPREIIDDYVAGQQSRKPRR